MWVGEAPRATLGDRLRFPCRPLDAAGPRLRPTSLGRFAVAPEARGGSGVRPTAAAGVDGWTRSEWTVAQDQRKWPRVSRDTVNPHPDATIIFKFFFWRDHFFAFGFWV